MPPTVLITGAADGIGRATALSAAGLDRKEWISRELRHSFVSFLALKLRGGHRARALEGTASSRHTRGARHQ